MKQTKTDNQTADASQNCAHCGTAIHFDEKVWMDATKGEGCTDDNGNEQVHAPSVPETPTLHRTSRTTCSNEPNKAKHMKTRIETSQERYDRKTKEAWDEHNKLFPNKAQPDTARHSPLPLPVSQDGSGTRGPRSNEGNRRLHATGT